MDLALLYPTKDLAVVKVGIITIKAIKLFGNQNLIISGELPYHIVSSMCIGVTPEQIKALSLADANRIIQEAWKQTHGYTSYIKKKYCECKKLLLINHSMESTYTRPNIYDKPHMLEGMDLTTMNKKQFAVKLKPLGFSMQGDMIKLGGESNNDALADMLLWCRVDSIDNKTDFVKDDVDIKLYRQIADLTDPDTSAITSMFTSKVVCDKCGMEHSSTLGWMDADFLQGR